MPVRLCVKRGVVWSWRMMLRLVCLPVLVLEHPSQENWSLRRTGMFWLAEATEELLLHLPRECCMLSGDEDVLVV